MAVRAILLPHQCEYTPTAAAQAELQEVAGRRVLAYDAAIDEYADWAFPVPSGFVGTVDGTLVAACAMASANTGAVGFYSFVEAITAPSDTTNLHSATGLTGFNAAFLTVPATAMNLFVATWAFTFPAGVVVPGDYMRVRLGRYATHGSDTAAGDVYVYGLMVLDTS